MAVPGFIFLLHGLLMPAMVMAPIERALRKSGFATRRVAYPSRSRPWRESVELVWREVESCGAERIHFVAHSMGGLVAAALLNEHPDVAPGRVVAIGTPFNGSAVARNMSRSPVFRRFLGGAEPLLVSGLEPNWTDRCPLHVIAGTSGIGLPRILFGRSLAAPNDGVVSVEECAVEGAASQETFPGNHTMLLYRADVIGRVTELCLGGGEESISPRRSSAVRRP